MQKWSRRRFLATLAATCAVNRAAEITGKGRSFPSVATRYSDPATEFIVVRLTDPHFTSLLPPAGNRCMTARTLLYASDIAGNRQTFRMDLKTRESTQLTEAADLDPRSLALLPNERGFWYFDGPRLLETTFANSKTREIYHVAGPSEKLPGAAYTDDGQHAVFIEQRAGRYRLQLLNLAKGTAATLTESAAEFSGSLPRPRHSSLVYSNAGDLWTIDFDGRRSRRLTLAEGKTPQARWTSDGRVLQYLNQPPDPHQLTSLREWTPESGEDIRVAGTSQFVRFHGNADSSVFVGVSGSKASPYLLLLIRSAQRELALAEHRATDAAIVNPIFSPNSQFVVFNSDRHGKPAIYSIAVDKLVTATDSSAK